MTRSHLINDWTSAFDELRRCQLAQTAAKFDLTLLGSQSDFLHWCLFLGSFLGLEKAELVRSQAKRDSTLAVCLGLGS